MLQCGMTAPGQIKPPFTARGLQNAFNKASGHFRAGRDGDAVALLVDLDDAMKAVKPDFDVLATLEQHWWYITHDKLKAYLS